LRRTSQPSSPGIITSDQQVIRFALRLLQGVSACHHPVNGEASFCQTLLEVDTGFGSSSATSNFICSHPRGVHLQFAGKKTPNQKLTEK
jgi:hypothetical protein